MASRIPRPLTEVVAEGRTPIERDDANRVNHFGEQHNVVRGLKQLQVLVVGARRDRGTGVEPQQAAICSV